jgi:hypothetical protein
LKRQVGTTDCLAFFYDTFKVLIINLIRKFFGYFVLYFPIFFPTFF